MSRISFSHRMWSYQIRFLLNWSRFWKGSCSGMLARGWDAKEGGTCCLQLGPLPFKICTSLSLNEWIPSKYLLPVGVILVLEREHEKMLLHGVAFHLPLVWANFCTISVIKDFPEFSAVTFTLGAGHVFYPSVFSVSSPDLIWHEVVLLDSAILIAKIYCFLLYL